MWTEGNPSPRLSAIFTSQYYGETCSKIRKTKTPYKIKTNLHFVETIFINE